MPSLHHCVFEQQVQLQNAELWALISQALIALNNLNDNEIVSLAISPSTLELHPNGLVSFAAGESDDRYGSIIAPELHVMNQSSREAWEMMHIFELGSTLNVVMGKCVSLSPDLEDLIADMMEPDPSDRKSLDEVRKVVRIQHLQSRSRQPSDVVSALIAKAGYSETPKMRPRSVTESASKWRHSTLSLYSDSNTSAYYDGSMYHPHSDVKSLATPRFKDIDVNETWVDSPSSRLFNSSMQSIRLDSMRPGEGVYVVAVSLLDGQTLVHAASKNTLVRDIMNRCLRACGIPDAAYFGLLITKGGQDIFLSMNDRIESLCQAFEPRKRRMTFAGRKSQVAHYNVQDQRIQLRLQMAVEFYVPETDMIISQTTRRFLYYQVLKDLVSGKMQPTPIEALVLAAKALRISNQKISTADDIEMKSVCSSETLTQFPSDELKRKLFQHLEEIQFTHVQDVRDDFLEIAQGQPGFGTLFYKVTAKKGATAEGFFWLGISSRGLAFLTEIHGLRQLSLHYSWSTIQSIDCRKHKIKIYSKGNPRLPAKQSFYSSSKDMANYVYNRCKAYHRFYLLLSETFGPGSATIRYQRGSPVSPEHTTSTPFIQLTPTQSITPRSPIETPKNHFEYGFDEPDDMRITSELTQSERRPEDITQTEEALTPRISIQRDSTLEKPTQTVRIHKGSQGCGIQLVGNGIVRSVKADGPANGILHRRDQIVSINGSSITGKSHGEIVELLRESHSPVVLEIVHTDRPKRRRRDDVDLESATSREPSPLRKAKNSKQKRAVETIEFDKNLDDQPGFRLGRVSAKDARLCVTHVVEGSAAARAGVVPGLIVKSLNRHNLLESSLQRATALLNEPRDHIELGVARTTPLASKQSAETLTLDLIPPVGTVKSVHGTVHVLTIHRGDGPLGFSVAGGGDKQLTGAYVRHVNKESPAEYAGLHEGDRILKVGTSEIHEDLSHKDILALLCSGDAAVELRILRLGKQQWDTLTQQALLQRKRSKLASTTTEEVLLENEEPTTTQMDKGPVDDVKSANTMDLVIKRSAQGYGFSIRGGIDKGVEPHVGKIAPGRPAALAGLVSGQVLLTINGITAANQTNKQLLTLVKESKDQVALTLSVPTDDPQNDEGDARDEDDNAFGFVIEDDSALETPSTAPSPPKTPLPSSNARLFVSSPAEEHHIEPAKRDIPASPTMEVQKGPAEIVPTQEPEIDVQFSQSEDNQDENQDFETKRQEEHDVNEGLDSDGSEVDATFDPEPDSNEVNNTSHQDALSRTEEGMNEASLDQIQDECHEADPSPNEMIDDLQNDASSVDIIIPPCASYKFAVKGGVRGEDGQLTPISVGKIIADGPAHTAGLRAHDVILEINGLSTEEMTNPDAKQELMKVRDANESLKLVVRHETEEVDTPRRETLGGRRSVEMSLELSVPTHVADHGGAILTSDETDETGQSASPHSPKPSENGKIHQAESLDNLLGNLDDLDEGLDERSPDDSKDDLPKLRRQATGKGFLDLKLLSDARSAQAGAWRISLQKMNQQQPKALRKEFEELGRNPAKHDTSTATQDVNMSLNRYSDILPEESSLVKVGPEQDYINANLIHIPYLSESDYCSRVIMTQGPKQSTTETFWKMIFEQKCPTIVMLTKQREGGKAKCSNYFPASPNGIQQFGDIVISCTELEQHDEYVIRVFDITYQSEKHKVCHFEFDGWADHACPQPAALVNFFEDWLQVQSNFKEPPVVHCSAGVGRTGVFAAMLAIRSQILRSPTEMPPISNIVLDLRSQRHNQVVQKKAQYVFLFDVAKYMVRQLLKE